ncbi:MAG TPA: carbamoyl-phosphate synthase large subunit [Elusimicrobiota bacterium]|nr:carbamoyl-phosphate synthase large subunit [Elusimicrobiota bacterium]
MPKRTDIHTILIIGSGPIVIGQACEFDYSGTQALKALKAEGYRIVLVNSNPATIMTDPELAHATYIEPLELSHLERIIQKERPQAILPTLGGQTALNLAMQLAESGILRRYGVELIGAKADSIRKAESRQLFKKTMVRAGLDVPRSGTVKTMAAARRVSSDIGFPLIIRPSFTLGGVGSAVVMRPADFEAAVLRGLEASPVHEVLLEESCLGWKEFELEVMRDSADQCVVICSIENLDPMGVHTGDSITVAPAQTLSDPDYQRMRNQAFDCIRAIGVDTGGSNVQFALHPKTGRLIVIEMNPRVSRSSALASKATGFPIAKIAALLAVGYRLDEIPNDITKKTPACFEPTLDYVVTKIPRFAFEKFTDSDQTLTSSMKSVGEVMAIGRTFRESLQKAVRGLEIGRDGLGADGKGQVVRVAQALRAEKKGHRQAASALRKDIREKLRVPNCDRIFNVKYAVQMGFSDKEIHRLSSIDPWFIHQIRLITETEREIQSADRSPMSAELMKKAKQEGFSDAQIGYLTGKPAPAVRRRREALRIYPTYKKVDTCAAEFPAETPYFYSTYEQENESRPKGRRQVMVLGGGPNRIGQGIEFDYCCVHAAQALSVSGFQTIMVNCNPETVSTDYDTSDRLYFEPLTVEDVLNIYRLEKPLGVIAQFGGQTPLNLAAPLAREGVRILGTSVGSIDLAEDREHFGRLLKKLRIAHPPHGTARNFEEARRVAIDVGYPVMMRPSYVLGGRAMEVVENEDQLEDYMRRLRAETSRPEQGPIFIDRFLENAKEIDVDAVSDGRDVWVGGIMEHIEEAGIHSGDSACVLPPVQLDPRMIRSLRETTVSLALALKVKGLINIQYAIKENTLYVLEANPRASRTVPFVSKATGVPLAKIATQAALGIPLARSLHPYRKEIRRRADWLSVKEVVLPWMRFPETDVLLGPEMRSTGEVMGIGTSFGMAFAKAQMAAGTTLPRNGTVLLSVQRRDREGALPIARAFVKKGFKLLGTPGTARYFAEHGVPIRHIRRISELSPNVGDGLKSGRIQLVVNTTRSSLGRRDGFQLRRAALTHNVPIITTVEAAQAAVESLAAAARKRWPVTPLQKIHFKQR